MLPLLLLSIVPLDGNIFFFLLLPFVCCAFSFTFRLQMKKGVIRSSPHLPGWRVQPPVIRSVLSQRQSDNVVQASKDLLQKYREGSPSSSGGPYELPFMDTWQRHLASEMHRKRHVVVSSATSTGKTYVSTLTAAYEVLSSDTATGLILSPNSEVLRDTVRDIKHMHDKRYTHSSRCMLATVTRNFQSYPPRRFGCPAQLLVITVDSVLDFVTDKTNERFLKNLSYVVFDEVHLPEVSKAMWWMAHLPESQPAFVLLSATMGDPHQVAAKQLAPLLKTDDIAVITCHVRPIPLQMLTYGKRVPVDKATGRSVVRGGALTMLYNPNDMTALDVARAYATKQPRATSDDDDNDVDGRDELIQSVYELVVSSQVPNRQDVFDAGHAFDRKALCEEVSRVVASSSSQPQSAELMHELLCYLRENDMLPALVFHSTTERTRFACEQLVRYIATLEEKDKDVQDAKRLLASLDDGPTTSATSESQGGRGWQEEKLQEAVMQQKQRHKQRQQQQSSQFEEATDDYDAEETQRLCEQAKKTLSKWRFSDDQEDMLQGTSVDKWIEEALEYGIGVYVSSMSMRARHYVFDAVREKRVSILFSDASISVGINLPIRTAIMCGQMAYNVYKQASGRAGRRGYDTVGYVVHLMDSETVIDYVVREHAAVQTLTLPTKPSFTDVVMLRTSETLKVAFNQEGEFDFDAKKLPPNELCTKTLENMPCDNLDHVLEVIEDEGWDFNRLTNLVKTLSYTESMVIVHLINLGLIKTCSIPDFVRIISTVLFPVVTTTTPATTSMSSFVPRDCLSEPVLSAMEDAWVKYDVAASSGPLNLDIPHVDYLHAYMFDGTLYIQYQDKLDAIKEWLYVLKKGLSTCVPTSSRGKYMDPTHRIIAETDRQYLAACLRSCVTIVD